MKYILRNILVVFLLAACAGTSFASGLPEKFHGKWAITVEKDAGFPWWEQVVYPVEIVIRDNGGYFVDQSGTRCDISRYYYDIDIDAIVLLPCSETKSKIAIVPVSLMSIDGEELVGRVQTYKLLFEWRGVRVGE